ncbi:MAG TPA: hypothetical protein VF111_07775 [Thermoanaerobaculia bacterium]
MKRLVAIAVLLILTTPAAFAGTSNLTLKRVSLNNVADAAGSWQFEGGTVFRGATQVGHFAATRRMITGGTNALNTSMFTMTLFFTVGNQNPPRNVTLQGAWTFSPGGAIGGVSAASPPYAFLQHDGTFRINPTGPGAYNLVINWTGAGTVP